MLTHLPLVPHIAPVNWVGIGSDNGLSPIWHQAIILTNAKLLSIGPLGTNYSANFNQNTKTLIHENASENVVSEMAAILSRGRWVNAEEASN